MNELFGPTSSSISLLQARQDQARSAQAAHNATAKNAQMLKDIDATATEFEAVFVAEMMKPMFDGISTEAPFGGGKGEEVFRGMLIQEYGKEIARTETIGLSSHIKREMIRMQEEASGTSLTPIAPANDDTETTTTITKANN